jgi:cyclin D6
MATADWELREEDASDYEFDLENPFTSPADEPIASLLEAEGHHAPSVSAAVSAARRDAAGFISKVRGPRARRRIRSYRPLPLPDSYSGVSAVS